MVGLVGSAGCGLRVSVGKAFGGAGIAGTLSTTREPSITPSPKMTTAATTTPPSANPTRSGEAFGVLGASFTGSLTSDPVL